MNLASSQFLNGFSAAFNDLINLAQRVSHPNIRLLFSGLDFTQAGQPRYSETGSNRRS